MSSSAIIATGSTSGANSAGVSMAYVQGETITFSNPTDPSPTVQSWTLENSPAGQTSPIAAPTTSSPTLLLDSVDTNYGSFRVRHVADGTTYELVVYIAFPVGDELEGERIGSHREQDNASAAATEGTYNEGGNTRGWFPDYVSKWRRVRARLLDKFSKTASAELSALTAKAALVDNDVVLIEDSAASFAKKKALVAALYPPGWIDGLAMSFNTVAIVDVAAGSCRDSTDTANIRSSGTLSANITSSGAGGLDTGSEASSTWYAVYIIGDSAGVNAPAAMLSASFTSPTLPGTHDVFRRVGAVRNNSSSDLEAFEQKGNGRDRVHWWDDQANHIIRSSVAGTTAYNAVSCSAVMPPTSEEFYGYAIMAVATAGNVFNVRATGATSFALSLNSTTTSSDQAVAPLRIPTDGSQSIDTRTSSVSDTIYLSAVGYIDQL